jgi:hypothetical protein
MMRKIYNKIKVFWDLYKRNLLLMVQQKMNLMVYKKAYEIWRRIVPSSTRHELAICAIFRNESRFIKEWIEFHKLVGVTRFYLYNHFSQDDYLTVLKPYIESGEVVLIDWPHAVSSDELVNWTAIQSLAYCDGIWRATKDCVNWLAVIDMDEFLFGNQQDNLVDILSNFETESIGGVCVNWQMYGTSHVSRIPDNRLMIESLVLKAPTDYAENVSCKSVARVKYITWCSHPHFFKYKKGYHAVLENKNMFQGRVPNSISVDTMRINHYWSRDEEHFFAVKSARRSEWNDDYENQQLRLRNINQIKEANDSILRFVPALSQTIFNKSNYSLQRKS